MASTTQYTPIDGSTQPSSDSNFLPDGPIPSYPDHGCRWSASCLACHLPLCVHDMNLEQVDALRVRRSRAVVATTARVEELLARGIPKNAAAVMVAAEGGVKVRTIYRRLSAGASNPPPSGDGPSLPGHSQGGVSS